MEIACGLPFFSGNSVLLSAYRICCETFLLLRPVVCILQVPQPAPAGVLGQFSRIRVLFALEPKAEPVNGALLNGLNLATIPSRPAYPDTLTPRTTPTYSRNCKGRGHIA
jgi:hypothetical protein